MNSNFTSPETLSGKTGGTLLVMVGRPGTGIRRGFGTDAGGKDFPDKL